MKQHLLRDVANKTVNRINYLVFVCMLASQRFISKLESMHVL
jgi:hypothetical protein